MWIEVVEGLRSNAYQKISFLRLEIHIYTHNYRYLPFDAQSVLLMSPRSPPKGARSTQDSHFMSYIPIQELPLMSGTREPERRLHFGRLARQNARSA